VTVETKIRQHQWVKITVTPISVLADDDGLPVVFVDPDKAEGAELQASYGCFACDAPLDPTFDTPCPGEGSP